MLGTAVTSDEAANITELARTATVNKAAMEAGPRRGTLDRPTATEMDYGRAHVAFNNYVSGLKADAEKRTVRERIADALDRPGVAAIDALKVIGGTAKSISSSIDNSFIGRQGIQMFFKGLAETATFPITRRGPRSLAIWGRTFNRSFKAIWDTFKGRPVMNELKAEIISDPQYDLLVRARVAIGTVEEEFPVTWPERVPIIGKFFEASDNAFTAAAYYMRYQAGKALLDIAEKTGVDLNSRKELESIGKVVNSLTARGDVGKSQKPGLVNAFIWSPRMIKAQFDILTAHVFDRKITPFARKQAALNLLQIASGTALVLAIAALIDPDSVEWDPRSSDFGKIKVGNTRFTVNPITTMTTLGSRLGVVVYNALLGGETPATKSATTGKLRQTSNKIGQQSGLDIVYNFVENKTAPAAGIVLNLLRGESRQTRKPPTVASEAVGAFTPLSIRNVFELQADQENADSRMDAALLLMGAIADGVGISVNTFSKFQGLTKQDVTEELEQAENREDAAKSLASRAWNREAVTPEFRKQIAGWDNAKDFQRAVNLKIGSAAKGLVTRKPKNRTAEDYAELQDIRWSRLKQSGVDFAEAHEFLDLNLRRTVKTKSGRRPYHKAFTTVWNRRTK